MLEILINEPLFTAFVWGVLYFFDAVSTNWYRDAYKAFLSNYVVYQGGIEMNPNIVYEINTSKKLSRSFYKKLILFSIVIGLFIWVGRYLVDFPYGWIFSSFVEIFVGATILLWLYVDLHHLYNYGRVYFLKNKPESLKGTVTQSYWYSQIMSAVEAIIFGILYLCVWIISYRFFFIGGAIACFFWAFKHYRFSKQL